MKFSLFFFANGSDAGEQYRLLLEAARFADRAGFTAVWTPERHFHDFGAPFPNPAVTGAAVASVTRRIDVRAGSVVLPLHEPLRVAEEWAVVDQLSGGRAGLAVASGWNPHDFTLAPDAFAERRAALRDGLREVRELWAGRTVSRRAPDGTRHEVRTHPRPVRGALPTWITAAGSGDTFAWAGEQGYGVLTHLLGQDWQTLEDNLVRYGDALVDAGHGPDEERVGVMLHTFVGADRDSAVATARGPMTAYMRSSMTLFGLDAAEPAGEPVSEEAVEELIAHRYAEYAATRCLIGSVDSCVPLVAALADLGVDEIACLIDFGVGTDEVLASLAHLDRLRERCADL
ncbi:MupA/Atu3671 family FMN-dependent luciferase-like monooxygenase [Streptomyces spectabilis]|uniref:LLM class flavin-dependent oxidoreductase n=1 Tax=Streptomyces spectabilis TaxID=68270 RepID=A0A5P2X2G6_STRST|nr:MupA/Atu3671 family FMN-dependent luciferase-like monooxygenase [Streptomyces spectabilis]MBB5108888.1 natural product biosynthesis luciferase-like monooxygenase protein [Streptomyces spectabilis]MCI3899818.1 LLM class flavin-dependent oxidoreductase [Streptomyces spectabilis]QEV57479.1 LLM class flavin-dependent oxidoreductase [Streptomyces spectabilis]GGV42738.1 siderophore biosynthesis protein [Streptomyces spectabilis]